MEMAAANNIQICFGSQDIYHWNGSCDSLVSKLDSLTIDSYIMDELNIINMGENDPTSDSENIPPTQSNVKFKVDELKRLYEEKYQQEIMTPLCNNHGLLDTHGSNSVGKVLCVSLPDGDQIKFQAKPDAASPSTSAMKEDKSRLKQSKDKVSSLLPQNLANNFTSAAVAKSKEPPKKSGGLTQLFNRGVETTNNDVSEEFSSMKLEHSPSKSLFSSIVTRLTGAATNSDVGAGTRVIRKNTTFTELDLFQECIERTLQQALFRGYLSKFIIVASTGYVSWCFYYKQVIDSTTKRISRCIHVYAISSEMVDSIWNGYTAMSARQSSYYLNEDAPYIIRALHNVVDKSVDLHSVRVTVADISMSTVYYITVPSTRNTLYVNRKTKTYAFKIVRQQDKFDKEVQLLRRVKAQWDANSNTIGRKFYYLCDSGDYGKYQTHGERASNYSWLPRDDPSVILPGGVIIMQPGVRERNISIGMEKFVFPQLLESVLQAHEAGVLHCDIRPCNIVKFVDDTGENWQVVDFGEGALIETTADTSRSLQRVCATITLKQNTVQYYYAGPHIHRQMEHGGMFVKVRYTAADDIEMLAHAWSMFGAVIKSPV